MMEAGRELDALVAEKVMGLDVYPTEPSFWYVYDTGKPLREFVKGYSTDIKAAWEVHKNICARYFSERHRYYEELAIILQAKANTKYQVDGLWLLSYLEPDDICLAALRAVGFTAPATAPDPLHQQ